MAIEDRDEDDDLAFLDQSEDTPSQIPNSQTQENTQQTGPLQPTTANIDVRRASIRPDSQEMPPPPLPRRSNKFTKPTSLADIRDTLSDLIGQPDSAFSMDDFSDNELENNYENDPMDIEFEGNEEPREKTPGPNPRRTAPDALRTAVIDRIALKRITSSSLSNSGDRLAFHSASKASESSFRVPSLLRRVTNASDSGSTTSAASNMMALGGKGVVKMGGSKKSSVNYYGRGDERKAKLDRIERERMEETLRVGKLRRAGPGLGRLTGGSWE